MGPPGPAKDLLELAMNEETVRLFHKAVVAPSGVLGLVISYAGCGIACRVVNKAWKFIAEHEITSVKIVGSPAVDVFRTLVSYRWPLRALILDDNAFVDDSVLELVVASFPQLEKCDVNRCFNVTTRGIELLQLRVPKVLYKGCWRALRPAPFLTPHEVVEAQLYSLQQDDAGSHSGIAVTYMFASPSNKASTGDLRRFTSMIVHGYKEMLNCTSFQVVPRLVSSEEGVAKFFVRLKKRGMLVERDHYFTWELSLQRNNAFEGCWMTDGVLPLPSGLVRAFFERDDDS